MELSHIPKMYPTRSKRANLLFLLNQQGDPAALAWKYIELQKQIRSDVFVERVRFYNDLIVQPILLIIFWSGILFCPWILEWIGFDVEWSLWNLFFWILSALQTTLRCSSLCSTLWEFSALSETLEYWKHVTHSAGGPFITGPALYSPLLYADAIARIKYSLETSLRKSS
jgi:hypothetical protein